MNEAAAPEAPVTFAPPVEILGRMIGAFALSQAIYVAAKLSIADRLRAGPKNASQLARESGTHPRALYRVLRALGSAGVFRELDGEHFALTPVSEMLRADVPGSLRPWAIISGEEWVRRPWSGVMESVAHNTPAFEDALGVRPFEYMAAHPDAAALFDAAMTSGTQQALGALMAACDFSRFECVVDIGGGTGTFLKGVLKAHPHVNGILFELPTVIPRAEDALEAELILGRCVLATGNFFESVPRAVAAGASAFVLKWILHNWDDVQALRILRNCRDAMCDDSRLLIVERLVGAPQEASEAKLLDLNMLVIHGGGERTEAEYRALLGRAGLVIERIATVCAGLAVIEAARR